MAIKFVPDIIVRLSEAGYNSVKIRNDKILGQDALQKVRRLEVVSPATINKICRMLNCQPGDIMEYVPDEGQ